MGTVVATVLHGETEAELKQPFLCYLVIKQQCSKSSLPCHKTQEKGRIALET